MVKGKATWVFLVVFLTIVILAVPHQLTYAQFIACRIVTFNPVPPTLVQAGQPFQVTTNLTVSCDPSVLPVVRVDLLDATTSQTLSTNSVPYYSYSSSFTVSIVNQVTARQLTGSWALQDRASIINGIDGQVAASNAQLFQVNVQPYTPPPVTQMQTTEMTTQLSNSSVAVTAIPLSATTSVQNLTEAPTSSQTQLAVTTQTATSSMGQFLVPAAILLVGILVFAVLIFAGTKRKQQPKPTKACRKCGAELTQNEKYCTSCGTKQET